MSINVKKSTFLLIIGSIFVMTVTIRPPAQLEELENLGLVKFVALREFRDQPKIRRTAATQSRIILERFRRGDNDETTVAQETEVPTESADVTKSSEGTSSDQPTVPTEGATPPITVTPNESLLGVEITTSGAAQDLGAIVKDQSGITIGKPSSKADQVDLKDDVQDVVIDSAKLAIHITDKIGNTVKHVSKGITDTVGGFVGGVHRNVQSFAHTIAGTDVNIAQSIAQPLGFGRIIPAISGFMSKPTLNVNEENNK